jgi:aminoglycoside 3-N-acetyltransferase
MLFFNKNDFKETLKGLGLKKGDSLFVHSTGAALGKITSLSEVIESFLEVIDYDGIIAMPAYTYSSWPVKHYFNPKTTKAETGIVPNGFIAFKDVYRTIQGNHSVAVWGDHKKAIIRDWVPSSFSRESTVYKTVENNFINVMIGTTLSNGCSMFHAIEEELQVPYRFRKSFPGVVDLDGELKEFDFTMYVRDLAYEVDLSKAEPFLQDAPFIRSVRYNYGNVTVFPLSDAYEMIKNEVKKNPLFFVSEINK